MKSILKRSVTIAALIPADSQTECAPSRPRTFLGMFIILTVGNNGDVPGTERDVGGEITLGFSLVCLDSLCLQ